MHLARASSITGYEKLVRDRGYDPVELLAAAGLTLRQLRAPNSYCAYTAISEALDLAADALDEPLFGLLVSSTQSTLIFGDLTLIAAQQPTLEAAMETTNRFVSVQAGGVSVTSELDQDRLRLKFHSETCERYGCLQKAQLSVGQLAMMVTELLGLSQPQFPICLRQSGPTATTLPESLLQRIRFNAPYDGIEIPASWRHRKPHRDEAAIRQHLEHALLDLQAKHAESFVDQVKTIIGNLLPLGESTVTNVARTLGFSARGLQQRLSKEGTTFGELLAEVRQSIAQQHLSATRIPITDLALSLGYAEVSVFSRQFKKWTGQSPLAYRTAQQPKHH